MCDGSSAVYGSAVSEAGEKETFLTKKQSFTDLIVQESARSSFF
jgi:hypothetical protein